MIIKQQLPAFDTAAAGSTATVKLDIFSRNLQNADLEFVGTRTAGDGKNYTGKTGAAITAIAPSAGTGAAGTLTVSAAGVPTAIAITAGGSGWAVGDKFTIYDPTGYGLVCTVATLSSTAIATATVGGGPLFAEDACEYVQLVADSNIVTTFRPSSMRKLDECSNLTRDVTDKGMFRVPFAHIFHPWSQWGSKDIGQLQLQVKLKDTIPGTLSKVQGNYRYAPVNVPVPRGDVLIQTDIPVTNVVAGWNLINDLPWQRVVAITKLLFDANAITQVKIKVGDRNVYDQTKRQVLYDMQQSPQYRVPEVTDFFLAFLDDRLSYEDFVYIVGDEAGTPARRPVQIEYYWDSSIAAPASFYILAQGMERGAKEAVAVAKA